MIRALRLERAWSQEQLAECSGLSVRTVQRLENGDTRPALESCKAIAAALGVDVKLLMQEPEPMADTAAPITTPEPVPDYRRQRLYRRMARYAFLIAMLFLINLFAGHARGWWFVWPALFMGLMLVWHALEAFGVVPPAEPRERRRRH